VFFLHQSVDCPHCGSYRGEQCVRPSDKPAHFMERRAVPAEQRKAIASHKRRTNIVETKLATEKFIVALGTELGQFKPRQYFVASTGENGTYELHYRLADGAKAELSATRHQVEFTCWEDQLVELGIPLSI